MWAVCLKNQQKISHVVTYFLLIFFVIVKLPMVLRWLASSPPIKSMVLPRNKRQPKVISSLFSSARLNKKVFVGFVSSACFYKKGY